MSLAAGVLVALVAGLGGLAVPALIARIPEPDAESDEPKEPYVDLARLPGLAWRCGVVAALVGSALGLRLGWDARLLVVVPLVPICVALAVVDWRTRLLPIRVVAPTYGLVVVAVLVVWLVTRDGDDLVRAGGGWLVYGGLFHVLWWVNRTGLGYGDVRLAGVLGLALGTMGWPELLFGIWSATLIGGVLGLVLTRLSKVGRRHHPYGPSMVAGALLGILLGPTILIF